MQDAATIWFSVLLSNCIFPLLQLSLLCMKLETCDPSQDELRYVLNHVISELLIKMQNRTTSSDK